MDIFSHMVIDQGSFDHINNAKYTNVEFIGCRISASYNSKFINCVFKDCDLKINSTYCDFLGCNFLGCSFGGSDRYDRSLFYKCNFDNSIFDYASGIKFKRCSLNGTVINILENSTIIKCSDKFLTIYRGENIYRVNHHDMSKKVVKMSAPNKPSKVISGGNVKQPKQEKK